MQNSRIKQIIIGITFILFVLLGNTALAQETVAFPGAEGFGKFSEGGRGGKVIKVTNLNDKGPGSLRAALEAEGSRIVVFSTGGIIDLETPIIIENPYITIAGQTAPGDGIAIRGNGIRIRTNNVVMRFLRIRPGDVSFGPENDWSTLDALTIGGGEEVFNVIVDHCSIGWSIDENLTITKKKITIQNSIISEGFSVSKHSKGEHSKGILVRSEADSISIINNLIAHNMRRSPRLANKGLVDVRNNIIYNPGARGLEIVDTEENQGIRVNIVNNFFIEGPNSNFKYEIGVRGGHSSKIFLEDNTGFAENGSSDNWNMVNQLNKKPLYEDLYNSLKSNKEFFNMGVEGKRREEIYEYVNRHIGASLPERDHVDRRLIRELNNKEGKIIDSQNQVGGWPNFEKGLPPADSENNGIADSWMEKNKVQSGEEHLDFDDDGFTNIEEYINGTDPDNPNNRKGDVFQESLTQAFTPSAFELKQNFPNPFQSYTKVGIDLDNRGRTKVSVYNYSGQEVETLLNNSNLSPGEYELVWQPNSTLSSGIYFLQVIHDGKTKDIPMTYIK